MRLLALTLATLLLPLEVCAQTAWFELPVPTQVLAPLGVDLTLGTSLALERTVRVLHATPREGDAPAHIAEFESLVAALDTFELEAQRLGPRGLSLEMSRNASERDVLQDVLKTLGFRLRERRGTYTVEADRDNDEAARRKLLDAAGLDTTTIAARLNAGETLTLAPELTVMPSPLPLDVWAAVIFQRVIPSRALFSAIARDRRAALLFVGLKAMTPATRAYLATDRDLLRRLYEDGAGAVAAFGEVLQVDTAAKLVLPGGPNATSLWQGVVDEPVDQVDRFARAIFSRDSGRLAFFVSTLARLDEPHRNFALGMSIGDQGIRLDRFRALYRTFVDIDSNWSVATLPFVRPLYDPATLLSLVRVDAAGAPATPNFRRLWDKALDGVDIPSPGAREVGNAAEDGRVDAAWLAEHTRRDLFDDRRGLAERVAFGQRVFSTAGDGEMEDVLTALRAFGRFPALMLATERIGVRNPAVFVLVARRAREMEDITEPALAVPMFGQFQGVLALLERVARTGAIDLPNREALVRSLTALPILEGRYNGALAGWLSTELLPAFGPQTGERPLESALLRGLAERGEAKPFEWEGSSYVTDLPSRSLRELEAIRDAQGGNHLDDVLALWTATRALEQPNLSVDAIKQGTASLKTAGAHLQPLRPWPDVDDELVDVKRTLERAVRDLSRITKPKDAEKAARVVRPVARLVDALLAETVVALAYAPWLGDSTDIRGPQADISHRHSFGLRSNNGAVVERRAWQRTMPDGSRAAGSGFVGSLLALDLVMAPKRLRRLATDAVPSAPRLNPNDRIALIETLALLNPRELNTTDLQAAGHAVAKGRALVQSTKDAAGLDMLAGRASVPGHRRQALSWAIQHEAGHVERLFSMSELLALGLADNGPGLDPWGTTGEPTSGCFCVRFPSRNAWEVLAGRPGRGLLAAAMPDVTLRSLEHMASLDVPAALAPGVVAMATQSFIDTAPALYDDDWVGLVGHTHGLTRESVEDYVAALVADGPVRPVASGDSGR